MINAPNGKKWLEIKRYRDIHNWGTNDIGITIVDYFTNTTVLVNSCEKICELDVIAPLSVYANSNGLLVNGCARQLKQTEIDEIFSSK